MNATTDGKLLVPSVRDRSDTAQHSPKAGQASIDMGNAVVDPQALS
jgi:hypothetical protein